MFIITRKTDDVIFDIFNELDYLDNGYPRNVEDDVAYVTEEVNVYSVDEVPEEVEAIKYCYTDIDGFYIDPNYILIEELGASEEVHNEKN